METNNTTILNNGERVTLLASTPNAKRVAFAAIRSCYSADNAVTLFNEGFDEYEGKVLANGERDSDRLIRHIVGHGHTSTLEHVTFTFAVHGVSRALLGQLTRHRIGWSYSVQSQRYVKQSTKSKHGAFGFVMPDLTYCKDNDAAENLVEDTLEVVQEAYDGLVALGVKAEDARSVLPMNSACNLVVTCNLRALIDLWNKRGPDTHAQAEIRGLTCNMVDKAIVKEPWIAGLFEMKGEGH